MMIFIGVILLIGFTIFFLAIFFQFHKIEKQLDSTVSFVESYLLNKFGEIKESIKQEQL